MLLGNYCISKFKLPTHQLVECNENATLQLQQLCVCLFACICGNVLHMSVLVCVPSLSCVAFCIYTFGRLEILQHYRKSPAALPQQCTTPSTTLVATTKLDALLLHAMYHCALTYIDTCVLVCVLACVCFCIGEANHRLVVALCGRRDCHFATFRLCRVDLPHMHIVQNSA